MKVSAVTDDYEYLGEGVWAKYYLQESRGKVYQTRRLYYEKKCIRCGSMFLAIKSNKTARYCGHSCHAFEKNPSRINQIKREQGLEEVEGE